jgi:hypothetical protein
MICFWDVSFWHCLSKKIWFKYCLTPKNLITASFNTKKYCLSIIYYREIYKILWILVGYHLKSKNSLKRDDTEKYHSSIVQAHLSQILKSSILTLKQYIFEIHTFCLISEDLRSQIISYCIFSLKCHC